MIYLVTLIKEGRGEGDLAPSLGQSDLWVCLDDSFILHIGIERFVDGSKIRDMH